MTQWATPAESQTAWSGIAGVNTPYSGRDITDKGAIMDDAVYTMDSSLINMDDAKLNNDQVNTTNWT